MSAVRALTVVATAVALLMVPGAFAQPKRAAVSCCADVGLSATYTSQSSVGVSFSIPKQWWYEDRVCQGYELDAAGVISDAECTIWDWTESIAGSDTGGSIIPYDTSCDYYIQLAMRTNDPPYTDWVSNAVRIHVPGAPGLGPSCNAAATGGAGGSTGGTSGTSGTSGAGSTAGGAGVGSSGTTQMVTFSKTVTITHADGSKTVRSKGFVLIDQDVVQSYGNPVRITLANGQAVIAPETKLVYRPRKGVDWQVQSGGRAYFDVNTPTKVTGDAKIAAVGTGRFTVLTTGASVVQNYSGTVVVNSTLNSTQKLTLRPGQQELIPRRTYGSLDPPTRFKPPSKPFWQ